MASPLKMMKGDIQKLQEELVKTISSHKLLYDKLKAKSEADPRSCEELQELQKQLLDICNQQQRLLEKWRSSNVSYKFSLYEVPRETKKRSRKDLSLVDKPFEKKPMFLPSPSNESQSSDDTQSSDSSSESSSDEEITQASQPIPLPRARPSLLPVNKPKPALKLGKDRNKNKSEGNCAMPQLPPLPEEIPSPEPVTEEEKRDRFFNYFGIISLEKYKEIESRKQERRRRSTTTTNNPQFLYDNWKMPEMKKNKSYLALPKVKTVVKKEKGDVLNDKGNSPDREVVNCIGENRGENAAIKYESLSQNGCSENEDSSLPNTCSSSATVMSEENSADEKDMITRINEAIIKKTKLLEVYNAKWNEYHVLKDDAQKLSDLVYKIETKKSSLLNEQNTLVHKIEFIRSVILSYKKNQKLTPQSNRSALD